MSEQKNSSVELHKELRNDEVEWFGIFLTGWIMLGLFSIFCGLLAKMRGEYLFKPYIFDNSIII